MEILKESNIVRDALFSNTMLRDHVKKEVGSDLSYRRSYLKKKIFDPEMKRACIEEFAKHLFGSRACFEGVEEPTFKRKVESEKALTFTTLNLQIIKRKKFMPGYGTGLDLIDDGYVFDIEDVEERIKRSKTVLGCDEFVCMDGIMFNYMKKNVKKSKELKENKN
jgi:hypothetical protein